MSAFKDSAIKLFGKTIPLFSVHLSSLHQSHQLSNQESSGNQEEETTTSSSSGANKKPKTSSPETAEIESLIQTTPEKIGEEGKGKEKTLKKPDKILACPRCNSMDTKFCYYNNYNVNQPRHMCKKCQRYWTAGGTMRNVPVGAGRRKNKNSTAAHFRHTFVQASINGLQYPCFVNNNSTTFLTFGSDRTDNLLDREQVQVVGNQRFIDQVPYVSSANFVVPNGLFNGFSHAKSHDRSSSLLLLQANPAALHRSLNFHERN